jgi:outer membrane protein assembly factor BamD
MVGGIDDTTIHDAVGPEGARWMGLLWLRVVLFGLVLGAGCASSGKEETDEDLAQEETALGGLAQGETIPTVEFADTAEENWRRGKEAFKDEDYLVAQRYFAHIRWKFPYSRFAAMAELRNADCQFARGRQLEAVDSYQNFARSHPSHPGVPHALIQTGRAYVQQIPSDWFFLPPSNEKDQTAVRDAEVVLRQYVERFPEHESAEEGRELLDKVRKKLLEHEQYVANFYKRLGRDRAYVGRLETIRSKYPESGVTDDLLLEIARVYAKIGEEEKAQAAIDELRAKFPNSDRLKDGARILAFE